MSSSESPASILFNTDGYAVGALFDGEFIPIDNVGLLVAGTDGYNRLRYLRVSETGALHVSQSSSKSISGRYFVGSGLIQGSLSQQNLITITNPSGSGRSVFINKITVHGVIDTVSTTPFLYIIKRTSDIPSSGTILSSEKRTTVDLDPVAVIRQSPSTTLESGVIWASSPGVSSASGFFVNGNVFSIFDTEHESFEIEVAEGESLAVVASANTLDWSHFANLVWSEVIL